MRAIICISIAISLTACGHLPTWVPKPPVIDRCTYSIKFKKWRCTNSATNVSEDRALNDPRMENAQAVSLDDYNKGQAWWDSFRNEIRNRCDL